MNIFGVGPAEAGLVFVIALIVVGPQRFPEIMRSAGRWYRMARAYSNEVMKDVRTAVDDIEREVKAETDDLKSVREFADVGEDLRQARTDTEALGRETDTALREDDSNKRTVRPSQRTNGNAADGAVSRPAAAGAKQAEGAAAATGKDEGVPPIEQTSAAPVSDVSDATPDEPTTKTASNYDPFKREPKKRGPARVRPERPERPERHESAVEDGEKRP